MPRAVQWRAHVLAVTWLGATQPGGSEALRGGMASCSGSQSPSGHTGAADRGGRGREAPAVAPTGLVSAAGRPGGKGTCARAHLSSSSVMVPRGSASTLLPQNLSFG